MIPVPRLHLISDRHQCPIDRFVEVARIAANAGVDAVHIRERDISDDEVIDLARILRPELRAAGCALLLNDSVDLVELTEADGVQLPERSVSPEQARQILPQGSLIGVSVHSADFAIRAESEGADFVIAGHVFETGSKPGQSGRGLEFINDVSSAVRIPVIAIGGISPENSGSVVRAGAHGVAVMSAILRSDEPAEVARQFRAALEEVEVREA